MKKIYIKNKTYYRICSVKRHRRRLKSKNKKLILCRSLSFNQKFNVSSAKYIGKDTFQVVIPEKFGFNINYEETVEALDDIRRIISSTKYRLNIDFSKIEYLGSTASLALASELYRWKSASLKPIYTRPYLWNEKVKLALYQMGLFQLLNISYKGNHEVASDREFVKFIFGSTTDGESARQIRLALEDISAVKLHSSTAYIGLTEAMTNVIQHAYRDVNKLKEVFNVEKPWWLGGSYCKLSDTLTITLCDQGVGIPKTLPKKYGWEKINTILRILKVGEPDDASMIEAAFKLGASGTGKSHQGKGLEQVRAFIDKYDNASFRILSLRGEYLYLRDKGKTIVRKKRNKKPFNGTIIEWKVSSLTSLVEKNG